MIINFPLLVCHFTAEHLIYRHCATEVERLDNSIGGGPLFHPDLRIRFWLVALLNATQPVILRDGVGVYDPMRLQGFFGCFIGLGVKQFRAGRAGAIVEKTLVAFDKAFGDEIGRPANR